jgi:hypothetical protein
MQEPPVPVEMIYTGQIIYLSTVMVFVIYCDTCAIMPSILQKVMKQVDNSQAFRLPSPILLCDCPALQVKPRICNKFTSFRSSNTLSVSSMPDIQTTGAIAMRE